MKKNDEKTDYYYITIINSTDNKRESKSCKTLGECE